MPKIKEGLYTFPEISAFLGGLFFTALLLLIQYKDKYSINISIFNHTLPIQQYFIICLPITITTIFFMFSSIFFGSAVVQDDKKDIIKAVNYASNIFLMGVMSMFISLFIILFLINIYIAIIGITLSFIIFYGYYKL